MEDNNPRGVIFNIQRYSIHDGPGIRTTVFSVKGTNESLPPRTISSQSAFPEPSADDGQTPHTPVRRLFFTSPLNPPRGLWQNDRTVHRRREPA